MVQLIRLFAALSLEDTVAGIGSESRFCEAEDSIARVMVQPNATSLYPEHAKKIYGQWVIMLRRTMLPWGIISSDWPVASSLVITGKTGHPLASKAGLRSTRTGHERFGDNLRGSTSRQTPIPTRPRQCHSST
jgi:hypothetical protein